MAIAWSVADQTLWQILNTWLVSNYGQSPWQMDLFVNDIVPAPGDELSDFVPPTSDQWPDYQPQGVPTTGWQPVQITNHVAESFQQSYAVFVLGSGVEPVTVYGYTLSLLGGDLILAQSFDEPVVVQSPGGIQIQPWLYEGMCTTSPPTISRRGRARQIETEDVED